MRNCINNNISYLQAIIVNSNNEGQQQLAKLFEEHKINFDLENLKMELIEDFSLDSMSMSKLSSN